MLEDPVRPVEGGQQEASKTRVPLKEASGRVRNWVIASISDSAVQCEVYILKVLAQKFLSCATNIDTWITQNVTIVMMRENGRGSRGNDVGVEIPGDSSVDLWSNNRYVTMRIAQMGRHSGLSPRIKWKARTCPRVLCAPHKHREQRVQLSEQRGGGLPHACARGEPDDVRGGTPRERDVQESGELYGRKRGVFLQLQSGSIRLRPVHRLLNLPSRSSFSCLHLTILFGNIVTVTVGKKRQQWVWFRNRVPHLKMCNNFTCLTIKSAGVEAGSLNKYCTFEAARYPTRAQQNTGYRLRVNLTQMVRELERRGAPHMRRSAFAFAFARLPSAPHSHVVKNLLEYAVIYFLPIHAVSAQFHEPKFK
ncbi:hypothetical protein B0H14DRAFT_2609635 [Mycena olivaceomarginata]|nr:hypothetical protein B0H14DRAFT_2609635 [Mycena olivaceomarginata]